MSDAKSNVTTSSTFASTPLPEIRVISVADVWAALAEGHDDFRTMRTHVIFLGLIYAILGFVLIRVTFQYGVLQLAFPLIAGFALIGPLAAIGLYELSRRRERGMDASWWHMFGVLRSASIRSIAALGLILLMVFWLWVSAALWIYDLTFVAPPTSLSGFAYELSTTRHGWTLILLGNGIGAVFALFVFVISVVSFPLLVDQHVGLVTAVTTSVKAVIANPVPMIVWGLIVAGMLIIGCIPIFLGLAVVLPVLGHATWHLYRKVVVN